MTPRSSSFSAASTSRHARNSTACTQGRKRCLPSQVRDANTTAFLETREENNNDLHSQQDDTTCPLTQLDPDQVEVDYVTLEEDGSMTASQSDGDNKRRRRFVRPWAICEKDVINDVMLNAVGEAGTTSAKNAPLHYLKLHSRSHVVSHGERLTISKVLVSAFMDRLRMQGFDHDCSVPTTEELFALRMKLMKKFPNWAHYIPPSSAIKKSKKLSAEQTNKDALYYNLITARDTLTRKRDVQCTKRSVTSVMQRKYRDEVSILFYDVFLSKLLIVQISFVSFSSGFGASSLARVLRRKKFSVTSVQTSAEEAETTSKGQKLMNMPCVPQQ